MGKGPGLGGKPCARFPVVRPRSLRTPTSPGAKTPRGLLGQHPRPKEGGLESKEGSLGIGRRGRETGRPSEPRSAGRRSTPWPGVPGSGRPGARWAWEARPLVQPPQASKGLWGSTAPRRPGDTASSRKGPVHPPRRRLRAAGAPRGHTHGPWGRGGPPPPSIRVGGSSVCGGFGHGPDRQRAVLGAQSDDFPHVWASPDAHRLTVTPNQKTQT